MKINLNTLLLCGVLLVFFLNGGGGLFGFGGGSAPSSIEAPAEADAESDSRTGAQLSQPTDASKLSVGGQDIKVEINNNLPSRCEIVRCYSNNSRDNFNLWLLGFVGLFAILLFFGDIRRALVARINPSSKGGE